MKKDDCSKSVDDATRRRALQNNVKRARARNGQLPPEHIEEIIDQALDEVRVERSSTRR